MNEYYAITYLPWSFKVALDFIFVRVSSYLVTSLILSPFSATVAFPILFSILFVLL